MCYAQLDLGPKRAAPTRYCVGYPACIPARQLAENPRQIMLADLVSGAVWFVIVISLRLRGFQVKSRADRKSQVRAMFGFLFS